jgi:hypothetical protein
MNKFIKLSAGVALAGALAITSAAPSQARHGHNAAAIGFGVGAVAGAVAAGAAYNNGYYYGGGYAYDPGYAAYDYDYAPGYVYDSGPSYYVTPGYGYYGNSQRHCGASPASGRFDACN